MKFLCLVYMDGAVLGDRSPEQLAALNEDSLAYNEVLQEHGRLLAAEALQPAPTAAAVRLRGGRLSVTDGPFAETKEQLGGFILVDARDRQDAIRIASGIPLARLGATIEVRPLFDIPGAETPTARPEPHLEARPALQLAGIVGRFTPATLAGVPAQWARFAAEAQRVREAGRPLYGIAHTHEDGGLELMTAVELAPSAQLPQGWERRELPAHRHAVLAHPGHVSAIPRSIDWVSRHWFPASGLARSASWSGAIGHVERFGPGFDPRAGVGDIELWFPVEG